jgi:hypothetical protein
MQENAGIENRPRRKRRSREQIAELVREFKSSGLTQRKFSENRRIALSELHAPRERAQVDAVQMEADEGADWGLECKCLTISTCSLRRFRAVTG